MAAGLALDPGITAIARQAGSPIMAVCLAAFALGSFLSQKNIRAGILAGLAFLSGPAIFTGIFCAGLAWLASKRLVVTEAFSAEKTNNHPTRQFLLSAAAAIILVGSLFFRQSHGLSAIGETLSSFITGFSPAVRGFGSTNPGSIDPLPTICLVIRHRRHTALAVQTDLHPGEGLPGSAASHPWRCNNAALYKPLPGAHNR